MAGRKLTEKTQATSVKDSAKFVITQPEGTAGSEIESVRRAQMSDVIAALEANGINAKVTSAQNFDEYLINGGEYVIKASDIESGQWSYSTKTATTTRARTKNLLPVRAGMTVTYANTTFDTYFGVLETPTSSAYIQVIGWKTDGSGTISITQDGWLTFIIRNHADTSATVDPADYDSTVEIATIMRREIDDNTNGISAIYADEYLWEQGTISLVTGSDLDSDTRIRNLHMIGVSTGVSKVSAGRLSSTSAVGFFVLAWDSDGNYVGHYNEDEVFSTEPEKIKGWRWFDCERYPNYVFRFVAYISSEDQTPPIISVEDGHLVKFQSIYDDYKIAEAATTFHLKGWNKGTRLPVNGEYWPYNTYAITNEYALGMSTGTHRITSDGVVMVIFAWDLDGNYIGHYNSDREFSKLNEKVKSWDAFDCSDYPDYVFRVAAFLNPASESITVEDGQNVFFHNIDTSLTKSGFPADAKAAGDRISVLETASEIYNNRITYLEDYTRDIWEKGSISPATGTEYSSSTQIRTNVGVGVTTGVKMVTLDDLVMYIMAWDNQGNYIGHYNSVHTFSTDASGYKLYDKFDCTLYPDYVFRFVAQYPNASTDITVEDGGKVKFIPAVPYETEKNGQFIESDVPYREITEDDLEIGSYNYSDKATNAKRLRVKRFTRVRAGMDIYFTSPTLKTYFGVLENAQSFSYKQASGWIASNPSEQVYHISNDGYLIAIFESVNDVAVDDFDSHVEIRDERSYRHSVNTGNDDLFKLFQRAGVIGDSISVGYIDSSYPVRNLIYSWPKKIMQDAGVPWLNFGTSGQTTLTWASSDTYGKVQMEAENNKVQAYLICLGCNDEWDTFRHVELGTVNDINDDPDVVATTYYGGYNRIIRLLKRRNPDCKIFCVTNPVGTESLGYNDAIRYIATQHYTQQDNVFLIELAMKYRRNINDNSFGIKPDRIGVHYSPYGYRMIATLMEKAIGETIRNNWQYFQDVAAIPYDTGTPTANTMTE